MFKIVRNSRGVQYKKETSTKIHHFKSDLTNSMDHMHISAIEPLSVILSQTK